MHGTKKIINKLLPKELLHDLYVNQYISIRQISKQFGFSNNAIKHRLKMYNIPRRYFKDAVSNYWKNVKQSNGFVDASGYRTIYGIEKLRTDRLFNDSISRRNGVREHRYIMENFLKRKLTNREYIHHIDGNKLNNKIENLYVLDPTTHGKYNAFLIMKYTNKETFSEFLDSISKK